MAREVYVVDGSLESRPGVFLIGSPNVGKRTLLSRLLSVDIPDTSDLSQGVLCQGWTIDTKYYSADISIWAAHLNEDFSFGALPITKQLAALVMVFDMSDESSFLALKDWVTSINLEQFEILLCIGNKADLVPGHGAHAEYRRYLQKHGESTSDPHPEFWDYGIDEAEGCSLLGEEETAPEIRKSCLDWCIQHNIEYIEACASNLDFDKCLSVDGDIQGVQRLYGALSAHMWHGMVMKSGENMPVLSPISKKEEVTDDESDYEIEYEVLSRASDEPWEYVGVSCNDFPSTSREVPFVEEQVMIRSDQDIQNEIVDNNEATVNISASETSVSGSLPDSGHLAPTTDTREEVGAMTTIVGDGNHKKLKGATSSSEIATTESASPRKTVNIEFNEDSCYGHEDLERLMCEVGSIRDSMRLMPDFQRREMAANLAMKMAAMFAGSSDEEGDIDEVVA